MIKAIITDVDGVIVGDKEGVNFPLPNERVIKKLREINKSGIPIILCTGKFSYAIEDIIKKAELDNPHITDGGALIYNPLRNQIIKEHIIDKKLATDIVAACLKKNIYLELHTAKEYYVQKNYVDAFTDIRKKALLKNPVLLDSLVTGMQTLDIIKILAFTKIDTEKPQVEKLLSSFSHEINAMWSSLPIMRPAMARVITRKGVSKMHASQEVVEYMGISFDECLGVGDLPSDWEFMKLCKYAATVGNVDEEFKKNVMSKGEGKYFLAPPVDNDGFIDIINHYTKF